MRKKETEHQLVPELDNTVDLTSTNVSSSCSHTDSYHASITLLDTVPSSETGSKTKVNTVKQKRKVKDNAIPAEDTTDLNEQLLCTITLLEHIFLLVTDVVHTMSRSGDVMKSCL
jgi:hypothetical protein